MRGSGVRTPTWPKCWRTSGLMRWCWTCSTAWVSGRDRAAQWFQAVSTTGTVPMARVPWNDPVWFQWVLDAGAYGIIVPLVNDGEEAAKAGMSCRYPPIGFRSIGPNRATLYAGSDYLAQANEEIICLVMVENINTIPNLEEMAKAPGIDGFYIGPADLAISMGVDPRDYRSSKEPRGGFSKGAGRGSGERDRCRDALRKPRGGEGAVRAGIRDVPGAIGCGVDGVGGEKCVGEGEDPEVDAAKPFY